jgi:biopolymer transport protein ExbB
MLKIFEPFIVLMESGGGVLWVLLVVGIVLGLLLAERNHFYKAEFPKLVKKTKSEGSVIDTVGWRNIYEREYYVSKLRSALNRRLSLIQVITFMCPLFGLLGTVTGMIAVFDVMAFKGLGNPRLMAGGVSQATLPTMVSMVVALVGLIGLNHLKSKKVKLELELAETFNIEEGGK